jgi:hypothetical protein
LLGLRQLICSLECRGPIDDYRDWRDSGIAARNQELVPFVSAIEVAIPAEAALYEDVNEFGIKQYSPPCITARRGGCVIKKISRSHRSGRRRGGFPFVLIGKPPRPRDKRMLRDVFLDRSATPPCDDARRGILLDSNSFTPSMTAHDVKSRDRGRFIAAS